MAKNYFVLYMDPQDHAIYHVWIHFISTSLYPRREKTIWSELESNPGPLASQATALTTRPWLLGLRLEDLSLKAWGSVLYNFELKEPNSSSIEYPCERCNIRLIISIIV